jgi:hypothetical protein
LSTSVGGTLTGRGGDFIVIDDPMKPAEAMSEAKRAAVQEWYDGTLYSRLDDRTRGVIVLVMQRLHLDDLVGHVLGKEEWVHLDLPAIAEAPQRVRVADDLGTSAPSARCCTPRASRWPSWSGCVPRWAATPSRRSTSSSRCRPTAAW